MDDGLEFYIMQNHEGGIPLMSMMGGGGDAGSAISLTLLKNCSNCYAVRSNSKDAVLASVNHYIPRA